MKLATAIMGAVDPVCRMQVDRPAAVGHGIVMIALFNDVLLAKQMIAHKTTAFALTRNDANPFDGHVGCFRELAGVFNVIPHPQTIFHSSHLISSLW
jgi:hypothetical protein